MTEEHEEGARRFPKPPPAIYVKLPDDIRLELDALEAAWLRAEAIEGKLVDKPLELVRIQVEELLRRGCTLDVLNVGDLRALHKLDERAAAQAQEAQDATEASDAGPAAPEVEKGLQRATGLFE